MSTGRKEAELFYKRRLDKWRSRSARIVGKAQALNRTQDKKLENELDMLEKGRDISIRRTHEDIWKVSSKDCPVRRLPKPSDLPAYLEGAKPVSVTLPTPAELASLLPKKIVRQRQPGTAKRYQHISKKRLSMMGSAEIQVFHYRKLLERQKEIKTEVVGILASLVPEKGDKNGEQPKTDDNNKMLESNQKNNENTETPKRKISGKWAFARNNLKAIAEHKEPESTGDENNNDCKESSGPIKVDLEVTRITITRKPIPNSTPKRRLSIDETPNSVNGRDESGNLTVSNSSSVSSETPSFRIENSKKSSTPF